MLDIQAIEQFDDGQMKQYTVVGTPLSLAKRDRTAVELWDLYNPPDDNTAASELIG